MNQDNNILVVRNIGIGWNPCTEENYPTDDLWQVVIAYVDRNDIDDNEQPIVRIWIYEDCPYGWNVLCRSEAYWMVLQKPFV